MNGFSIRFKKVHFGACLGLFGPVLGKFGPTEIFHSTLIQSDALTFSEEIRKKYQTLFEEYQKVKILGQIGPEFDPFSNLGKFGPNEKFHSTLI